jgi:hypothetical protein
MELAVSVTPHPNGFQARTGGPLDLTAEGPTADAAVDALRSLIATRFRSGVLRAITVPDYQDFVTTSAELGRSPEFDGWKDAVAEYRRLNNTIPDAGE